MLLSIIVPVYNTDSTYLKKCLDSILDQESINTEILIINDGSTDLNTLDMIEEYELSNENIKVIHQNNLGVSTSRNNGIIQASGEWIMFVDSDDFIERNSLKYLKENMKNEYDIIMHSMKNYYSEDYIVENSFLNQESKELTRQDSYELQIQILDKSYSKYKPKTNMVGVVACKIYNKDFLYKNNLTFDTNLKFSEDGIFIFKGLYYAKKIIYVDQYIYNYRRHENSVTNKINKHTFLEYKKAFSSFKRVIDEYSVKPNNVMYLNALSGRIIQTSNTLSEIAIRDCDKSESKNLIKQICKTSFLQSSLKQIETYEYLKTHTKFQNIKFLLLKRKAYNLYYIIVKLFYKLKK